jgi:Bacterial SH3 domain
MFVATGILLAAGSSRAAEMLDNAVMVKSEPIRAPKVWMAVVNANKLNVRGGPGDGFKVVETLELGANVGVTGQSGTWVRLDRPIEAWVARNFLKLPNDFLSPLFRDADNAFLDWAAATGNFEELSVESEGRLSVILTRPLYADMDKLEKVARDTACAFRERTTFPGVVRLTVWAPDGPSAGLVRQVNCP